MTHTSHLIFIICVLISSISQISADTASCKYSQKSIRILRNPIDVYTCELSVGNPNNFISVTDINGDHDENSDDDVKFLVFNQNAKLEEFSAIFCNKFPNLEAIKIENVKINSIDEDSLQECSNLKLFHLNNNNLREIPDYLFSENSELLEIIITANQLTSLAQPTFEQLENLKILKLENNKINLMADKVFVALKNLDILNFERNQLKALNPVWFKNLESLKQLQFGSNQISDLPEGIFANLINLEALSMRSNLLAVIHSSSFPSDNKIKFIELSLNKIDSIDREFVSNSKLVAVFMQNNICFASKETNKNQISNSLDKCFVNYEEKFGNNFPEYGEKTDGKPFSRGAYPWIAAIMKKNGDYYCGGALVSEKKVVTTAKCLYTYEGSRFRQMSPNNLNIYLGSHDLTNKRTENDRQIMEIASIKIHPKFNISNIRNDYDIAVAVLKTAPAPSKYVKSIKMTEDDSEASEITDGVVASYGYDKNKKLTVKSAPRQLETIITSECIAKNHAMAYATGLNTLCNDSPLKDKVCIENIGSGLFVKLGRQYYLRGILSSVVSVDEHLCDEETSSLYTDVAKYTAWIESIPEANIQRFMGSSGGFVFPN